MKANISFKEMGKGHWSEGLSYAGMNKASPEHLPTRYGVRHTNCYGTLDRSHKGSSLDLGWITITFGRLHRRLGFINESNLGLDQ